MNESKSFFESMPSKTSFLVGFIAAILVFGTLGFIFLGSCVIRGTCGGNESTAKPASNTVANNPAPAPQPAPQPSAAVAPPALNDADHVRGAANAPITIVEYSDFECPFCNQFHPTMLQVMDEYDGQVRWVYRHFPLSFHPQARPAALASECAGEQEKFWEFADRMFENQSLMSDSYFAQVAGELGMNVNQFTDCYESEKYADKVSSDLNGGVSAGVNGTPGSFVISKDGVIQQVKGAQPFSAVKATIDALL